MTDEELIARLRNYGHVGTVLEAADRIKALVKERDDCAIYLKDGETPRQRMDRDHADVLSLMQLLSQEKSRVERLVKALRAIESTPRHAKLADHDLVDQMSADARAALRAIGGE